MAKNFADVKIALRVLTAVMDRVEPDPADVAGLHRLAPLHWEEPIGDIACEVIQSSLRGGAEARDGR